MNENNEGFQDIDHDELVEFIFKNMTQSGMMITREEIEVILDLELLYMIENGFAVPVDEDELED